MNLPFWGDSIASVSKAAVRIYEEGLLHPWNYPNADPGHPTLFPWIIALCWMVLGQSLWVPHVLIAICLALLLKLMLSFVQLYDEKWQLWALLLTSVSPLFVAQAFEVSLALPLTLAFFAAYRGLKKGNTVLWVLGMMALSLLHLQGILLLGALGLYDIFRSWPLKRAWWKRFPYYFIPLFSFGVWMYFHFIEFGWALITPNYGRQAPGANVILYNLAITTWRLLDLGYFLLFLPVFFSLLVHIAKGRLADIDRLFIALFVMLCIGIPVVFADPPSHRYFLPVYILLVPLFIRWLQKRKPLTQATWLLCSFFILLSGNLWHYPGKCLGDQNLVFLSYFDLEKQIIAELPPNTEVHSFAPLNNASKFTWLQNKRAISYHDLYNKDFKELDWIVESNLNCEFTPEMRKELSDHFVPRVFETYGVYVNVWMNKRLQTQYPSFETKAHQASALEQTVQRLKENMRN